MNDQIPSLRPWLVPGLFLACAAVALFAAHAKGQSLGSAENFAVLGAATVTNGGASQISGDVGVSPGTAITGFPPGIITNGALRPGDAIATQAHADFATAYADFAGLASPPVNNLSGTDLGGLTLAPGVFNGDRPGQLQFVIAGGERHLRILCVVHLNGPIGEVFATAVSCRKLKVDAPDRGRRQANTCRIAPKSSSASYGFSKYPTAPNFFALARKSGFLLAVRKIIGVGVGMRV
jgi:hypothetical protein